MNGLALRRLVMAEAQQSTEPLQTLHGAQRRFAAIVRLDQPIVEPLMAPLPMIMFGVLASGLS